MPSLDYSLTFHPMEKGLIWRNNLALRCFRECITSIQEMIHMHVCHLPRRKKNKNQHFQSCALVLMMMYVALWKISKLAVGSACVNSHCDFFTWNSGSLHACHEEALLIVSFLGVTSCKLLFCAWNCIYPFAASGFLFFFPPHLVPSFSLVYSWSFVCICRVCCLTFWLPFAWWIAWSFGCVCMVGWLEFGWIYMVDC